MTHNTFGYESEKRYPRSLVMYLQFDVSIPFEFDFTKLDIMGVIVLLCPNTIRSGISEYENEQIVTIELIKVIITQCIVNTGFLKVMFKLKIWQCLACIMVMSKKKSDDSKTRQ